MAGAHHEDMSVTHAVLQFSGSTLHRLAGRYYAETVCQPAAVPRLTESYFVLSEAFLAMVTELERLRRRSGLERGRISGDLQHVVFAELAHHLRHEGGPHALAGTRLHVIHLPHEVAR
jgi:hypothetical protein